MATRPQIALASAFVIFGFVTGALPDPARADVDVELHPGARVVGSIAPGDPHEVFHVRAPRGATLNVVLRGVRSAGQPAAEGLTTVVAGPNVAPLSPVRKRRSRSIYAAGTTGLYTIRVLPGSVGGAYKLRVRVRAPRRLPLRGQFADAPLTFPIAAERGATARFVVRPGRGSGARPRLDRLRLGFTEIARFGDSESSTPNVHRVRDVPLVEAGEYQLTVTDSAGVGGAIAGAVILKPPRYERAVADVELLDPAGREEVYGRLVASGGGTVKVPDQGGFGIARLAGASLTVPAGAYAAARSVRIGASAPIDAPEGAFEPAGPTVRIVAPSAGAGSPSTVRLPFDTERFDPAQTGLSVFARGADGVLGAIPSSALELDPDAGTVSFPASGVDMAYRVFAPPVDPVPVDGDLDGDGFADLLVRSPDEGFGDGRVFGFRIGTSVATRFTSAADFTLGLDGPGADTARFGQRAATGDFDGDGQDDLAVTSYQYDFTLGAVSLFSATRDFSGSRLTERVRIVGQTFEELGDDVAIADVSGDGVADLIVSAVLGGDEAAGVVYVFHGRTLPAGTLELSTLDADRVLRGERADDWFGWSLIAADVTGDGFADIAVSTYPADEIREKVYVFAGGPGLGTDIGAQDADIRLTGANRADFFGSDLAAGDLTGDGIPDLVVGAAAFDATPGAASTAHGALYVFAGGPGLTSGQASSSIHRIVGGVDELTLGTSIQVADVTGDRIGDLIAGASILDEDFVDSDPGNVFVFVGGAGLAPRSTDDADATIVGDVDRDAFQIVEPPVDVNGDGVRDLIVAAPLEDVGGLTAGTYSVFFGGLGLLSATTATDADVRVIGQSGQALGGFPDQ